jgi:hypothetical protein
MVRAIAAALLSASTFVAAEDAHALLAKARTALLQNRERERFWAWSTTTTRRITSRDGRVIEEIPSVTVESPIRSDGRRCNAVLAWGDGREPYLANAAADARCTVEQETRDLVNEDSILASAHVRVRSRSRTAIVLSFDRDPSLIDSQDPGRRCLASLRGAIEVDPVSFFPRVIDLEVAGHGCEQLVPVVNHYDEQPVRSAMSTFRKGATARWEYQLQKDKAGNAGRDYWICVRRHSVRPLPDYARVLIVWGRRFELTSFEKNRLAVIDATTTASELSADVVLKFGTDPK